MARLLYFGRLCDVMGTHEEQLDLPSSVSTTSALRTWMDEDRDLGGALLEPSVRIALNNEIVSDPHEISNADEIAFMPPVGGG